MNYIKVNSLTFWAAATPLVLGLIVATLPLHGWVSTVDVINSITGNVAPAILINAGMAGIGVRKAIG